MKGSMYFILILVGCCAMSAAAWAQAVGDGYEYTQACCTGSGTSCARNYDCCNCDRIGLSGGASFYILAPYAQDNQAYARTSGFSTPNRGRGTTDFSWDYSASPAFWLGWESPNGWGVRSRLFTFQQTSNTAQASLNADEAADAQIRPSQNLPDMDIVNPDFQGSPGILLSQGLGVDRLYYSSSLLLNSLDLEATYDICQCPCTLLFSGGVRYMFMAQRYNQALHNSVTVNADTATETSVLDFRHNFHGIGPTAALEAHRQLGNTRLSLFGMVRGSLLVGDTDQSLAFNEVVDDPGGIAGGSQTRLGNATSDQADTLAVSEIEVGLEYELKLYRCSTFTRLAFVDQTYFGAGCASSQDGNLSLFGGQISIGVNY